jgi:hypothetical protein
MAQEKLMTRRHAVAQPAALWRVAPYCRLLRCSALCKALIAVIGALTILGCNGENGTTFASATASDLNDRSFTFANGAGPELAAMIRLPQGQAFTLQFANFGGTNVGPVTLDSGGSVASGTVTLGSCTFRFDQSTFPAGLGPPSGAPFTIDPCSVDRDNNTLQLTMSSGEQVVSSPAIPLPTTKVAFVLTTDFSTGSYSVVDLTSRNVFKDLKRGGVHSDAIARLFVNPSAFPNGRVYVVNRLGADSIQIIDPQLGFITPENGEISVGNGTNPQDIVFVNVNKAYVSCLASAQLVILNPTTLTRLGVLDLSRLVTPNDGDGSPEPAYMLMHNGLVYVVLQHIDFTQPQPPKVANGEVVVIDPTTDQIVTVIELHGKNPFSEIQFSPTLNRILISSVGDFGVIDGGIEAINPDTHTVDARFAISEATMGGDITAFVTVSRTKGFAIVEDANFANALITFDPSTGRRLKTIVGPLNVPVPQLAINGNNEVYLAITDTETTSTGLRIFDALTDNEITTTPLNVGQLPPLFTLFIE